MAPKIRSTFEEFVAANVHTHEFLNEFEGGVRQIFLMKAEVFNQVLLPEKDAKFKVTRVGNQEIILILSSLDRITAHLTLYETWLKQQILLTSLEYSLV